MSNVSHQVPNIAMRQGRKYKEATSKPSSWLLGSWRSDKEATVAAWGKAPPGPAAFEKFLLAGLGKLTRRFTPKRIYVEYEGNGSSCTYRVLWENKDSLFLVYGAKAEENGLLINFVSPDQYWVHAGRYTEYFSRHADG